MAIGNLRKTFFRGWITPSPVSFTVLLFSQAFQADYPFIKETRGIDDEASVRKGKKAITLWLTKAKLKTRIRECKGLKAQAAEEKDGWRIEILRRQTSRLKKQSGRAAV